MVTLKCEYCEKLITKINLKRHQNTKSCKTKRQNSDIIIKSKKYKCKYCELSFNRLDNKNEHELNCSFKDVYYKLSNKITEKEKENDLLKETIMQKNNDIDYFKSQLQIYRPNINYIDNSNNTNITINNNININIDFNDIKTHLNKFNIHVLSDYSAIIVFLMNIFSSKMKLTNECKQIISYYLDDKLINDIKCKTFLSNSANQLIDISDKICSDVKNNKNLNDTIIKSACLNNILLNSISTEDGIKNGIRKKSKHSAIILVHEIIKYLKENNNVDIKGV